MTVQKRRKGKRQPNDLEAVPLPPIDVRKSFG